MNAIELELSKPVGPESHPITVLKIRTELTASDAASIVEYVSSVAFSEAMLASKFGWLLTSRTQKEIDSLDGDDAAALMAVCSELVTAIVTGPRTPVKVRAPNLGELAEAESRGADGRLFLASICSGIEYEDLCTRPAAVFMDIHHALNEAKKGGPKTAGLLAKLHAQLRPATPESQEKPSG